MATPESKQKKPPNLSAYWEILRPNNIPASFGLVAAGALVASHTAVALFEPKVCSNRKKKKRRRSRGSPLLFSECSAEPILVVVSYLPRATIVCILGMYSTYHCRVVSSGHVSPVC